MAVLAGRFFVTGTDTGVGKTVVSAMLTLALDAYYWKPVQAGADPCTDREQVAAWTGLPPQRLLPEVYSLRLPASPHWSAEAEGIEIDMAHLSVPAVKGALVVEGAGGVLVPLNRRDRMIDLMQALALPVVLVARTELGTINHTLLSLEALQRRGISIHGVVLNGEPVEDLAATLTGFSGARVLGLIPRLPTINAAALRAVAVNSALGRFLGTANDASPS